MRDAFHYDQKTATTRLRGDPIPALRADSQNEKLGSNRNNALTLQAIFCEKKIMLQIAMHFWL